MKQPPSRHLFHPSGAAPFAVCLLALVALVAPAAHLQRRTAPEAAAAENALGETTFHLQDGRAVLRVGTDEGTVLASDPWAVHVAPRRRLAVGEYVVTVEPANLPMRPDGSILVATNVTDAVGAVTNRVVVRPLDPALSIAAVQWHVDGHATRREHETAADRATLTLVTTYDQDPPSPGGGGSAIVPGWTLWRGVDVTVWETDRQEERWDATLADVTLVDSVGAVPMSALRRSIHERYDWRTGEDWSAYPATNRVNLAGQSVLFNASGTLRADLADGPSWRITANGHEALRVFAGASERSDDLKIEAISVDPAAETATIAVNAALGVSPRIQTTATLGAAVWDEATVASTTYPATRTVNGAPCYVLTLPLDPSATSAFYRAVATVSALDSPEIHVAADAILYIDGARAAWTNITVSGKTFRVLAAQE